MKDLGGLMRKILLASFAANTIEKFIKKIEIQPDNKNIAFIPTASNIYQDWSPVEDRQKLIELGFNVKNISLEGKTKEQLYFELEEVDLIFVAGGNTFYLLQEARKSKFDEVIFELIQKGIPYIGSSAGTVFMGPSIELALDIDNQYDAPDLKNYDGLNIVDFVVLPHYDDENFREKIDKNLKKMNFIKYNTIKIKDNQAVMIIGEITEIVEV